MDIDLIRQLTAPGKRVHLVGIGGVSMCALAEVLHGNGSVVSGSDMRESGATDRLGSLGIGVMIGHDRNHIKGADCVIRTAAVHDDNPEVAAARDLGVPVFERAEVWGAIMKGYDTAVCVSGTHGKSTTTSMITHIAMAEGRNPTVMIGGSLPLIGGGHRVGEKGLIIAESCEYCNSFLYFFPTIAVILNVEEDHLDFFSGIGEIKSSFRKFAQLVPENGSIVYNNDDVNAVSSLDGIKRRMVSFGLNKKSQYYADKIEFKGGLSSFDIIKDEIKLTRISLKVPGRHNVLNALAAAAASAEAGIGVENIKQGLEEYTGLKRRFEYKGKINGALVYDDYAHHPSEIAATLSAAKGMGFKRILLVFQPHTYTRTKLLFDDFVKQLSLADLLILADIYAAREQNTVGVSSADLARQIKGAIYIPSFDEIVKYLKINAQEGDLILTMGAGDVYRTGEMLVENKDI